VYSIVPAVFGGLEQVVFDLATGLPDRGVEVAAIVVLEGAEVPVVARLRDAGVPVTTISIPGRGYLRERREVARAIRESGAGLVHTHGVRAGVIHTSAARSVGLPTVATFHGFTRRGLKGRAYEHLERMTARRTEAVVAVSNPIADELERCGVPRGRLHVIPNRAPETEDMSRDAARAELGLPEDRLRLAWMGRIFPEKGLDVLIDALLQLDVPTHLTVFGDGPDERTLKQRAAGRLEVSWMGYVGGAARYLPAFDGFVLSSRTEGWPLTLLEAMEAGTPVIATEVGGVPEILRPEEGLLVPPEDPGALARAVRRLADDRDGAIERAEAASRRVVQVRPDDWIGEHLEVYRAALLRSRGEG
jgi:glycosyltransferase involved in cell wall biosynthesis